MAAFVVAASAELLPFMATDALVLVALMEAKPCANQDTPNLGPRQLTLVTATMLSLMVRVTVVLKPF
jgi:hypothetical protein